MKKIIVFTVALLLLACKEEKKEVKVSPKPVKSMTIQPKLKTQKREFVGKVEATIKAELSFEVSGKLKQLPIVEGKQIKKGQLLAAIDPKRFQDAVDQAQAKYKLDKAQFERAEGLIGKNFISKSEYDILKSKMKIAKANLETTQKNLTDTKMYAPFNGFVAKIYVENYEHVKAKEAIMIVHDLEVMDVEIQIPEYIAKQIQSDSKQSKTKQKYHAFAIFDDFPKYKFPLTYKEYSSRADEQTQTYRVVYSMEAPKEVNVLPGMSVTVVADVPDYKNMKQSYFTIPSSSVFSSLDKKPQVWLIDPKTNKIHAVKIQTTTLTGNNIKVLKGLKEGDQIVVAGVHFLREGQTVKPIGSKIQLKEAK